MAQALKYIILLAAVALMFSGCNSRPVEVQDKPVLTFEQVKAVEPSMLTTDEITRLVKSDTTHNKVVYFFDILCKPCLEHLRNELATMYANRDTTQWRFYLVAGFNWLHRLIPDSVGNLMEDTLGNIVHFAKRYRDLLPSLGYDMKDVYMHYNPDWEHTDTGVFTPWAKSMFHSDHPFRCQYEGSPQLFIADRHGRIALDCIVQKNKDGDTTDQYYSPRCEYTLDTHVSIFQIPL
ncbi:MAG: hypothetical protein IJL48_10650 [Bacteroidales bacterium]|nr:hypothetical protein [Bacteroidales bacterium]